jgi:hypothetical protein
MWVYLEGGPSTAPSNKSSGGIGESWGNSFTSPSSWPVGSWTQIGGDTGPSETGNTFTLKLAIDDPDWSGWVYIDDVEMR